MKNNHWYDLHFFGITINPWIAMLLGASTYLTGGNLGGTLQPIGLVLILLAIVKIIRNWLKK